MYNIGHANRHEVCTSNDEPIIYNNSLVIRDKITDTLMMTPNTFEIRQFFNLNIDNNSDIDEASTSTDELIRNRSNNNSDKCDNALPSSDSTPTKWTDANAVRALISKWKDYENEFKSTSIRNN